MSNDHITAETPAYDWPNLRKLIEQLNDPEAFVLWLLGMTRKSEEADTAEASARD